MILVILAGAIYLVDRLARVGDSVRRCLLKLLRIMQLAQTLGNLRIQPWLSPALTLFCPLSSLCVVAAGNVSH